MNASVVVLGLCALLINSGCGAGGAERLEGAGTDIGSETGAQGSPPVAESYPVWRQGQVAWQWIRIPGSDLSSVEPSVRVPGNLRNRINAWNGLAADREGSRLFSVGNGGHADYAGNEAYAIDLSVDSPAWVLLREPTLPEFIVASNASRGVFNDYYLDGRPSSTHTYFALNYIGRFDVVFKFGAGSTWGTGNERNWKTDVFSLTDNDWMPAGSWPDVIPGERSDSTAASICMNPLTEQVYIAGRGLRRFEPESRAFTTLGPRWPDNSSAVYARGCAVDTRRNRIVYFGDGYNTPDGGLVYDIAANRLLPIRFSGDGLAEVTAKVSNFGWYDPTIDAFLVKTNQADRVYRIDPEVFSITRVDTAGGEDIPDAVNGVQTRWQWLPALGGYAYYARHGSGIWFLATR